MIIIFSNFTKMDKYYLFNENKTKLFLREGKTGSG